MHTRVGDVVQNWWTGTPTIHFVQQNSPPIWWDQSIVKCKAVWLYMIIYDWWYMFIYLIVNDFLWLHIMIYEVHTHIYICIYIYILYYDILWLHDHPCKWNARSRHLWGNQPWSALRSSYAETGVKHWFGVVIWRGTRTENNQRNDFSIFFISSLSWKVWRTNMPCLTMSCKNSKRETRC
jgi:hypothetical protein